MSNTVLGFHNPELPHMVSNCWSATLQGSSRSWSSHCRRCERSRYPAGARNLPAFDCSSFM